MPWQLRHGICIYLLIIAFLLFIFKNSGILILSFGCTVGLAGFGVGALTCGSTGAVVLVVFGTTGFTACAEEVSDRNVGLIEDVPSACPP